MLENRERMGGRGKSGGRRGFQSERERGRDGGGRVDGRRKGSNEIGEKERERNGREDILSLSLSPRSRARDAGACCRTSLGRGKRGIGEEGRGNCRRPRPW